MARNGMGLGLLGLGIILVLGAIVCMVMIFIPSNSRNANMGFYVFGFIAGCIGGGIMIILSTDEKYKKVISPTTP